MSGSALIRIINSALREELEPVALCILKFSPSESPYTCLLNVCRAGLGGNHAKRKLAAECIPPLCVRADELLSRIKIFVSPRDFQPPNYII